MEQIVLIFQRKDEDISISSVLILTHFAPYILFVIIYPINSEINLKSKKIP